MLNFTTIRRSLFSLLAVAGLMFQIGCGAERSNLVGPKTNPAEKATLETGQDDIEAEREALARQYPGLSEYELDNLIGLDGGDDIDGQSAQKTAQRTIKPVSGNGVRISDTDPDLGDGDFFDPEAMTADGRGGDVRYFNPDEDLNY